jgi:hypothetical protein
MLFLRQNSVGVRRLAMCEVIEANVEKCKQKVKALYVA